MIGQQILFPFDQIHIGQQHLDLVAKDQVIQFRVIQIQLVDVQFGLAQAVVVIHQLDGLVDFFQNLVDGQGKGMDRAFHALKQTNAD